MEGRELTEEENLEIRAAVREIDPVQMAIIKVTGQKTLEKGSPGG